MHLVITGANSFIGTRLAAAAVRRGWQVTLVVRHAADVAAFAEHCRVVELTMADYASLGKAVEPCDCLVHLAWNGTRGAARMDTARQQQNAADSLCAVRAMLEAGCRRVVTAGSQAEYGPHSGQISETSECRPNTAYGIAKLDFYGQASALCRQYGAACIEPRFFSLYGPGDYPGTMVISILKDMLAGHPCRLTKAIQLWDFLYIDDAVEALAALCENTAPAGVYNFGSGDVRPLKEYILEMARITATDSKLLFGAVPYPATGMVSLWPDVHKLRSTLAWQPVTTFDAGIRAILKALTTE